MLQVISWDNAVNRNRAELVFENRNKEYGAYQIRRNYEKQLIIALLYTTGAIGLLLAIPILKSLITGGQTKTKVPIAEVITIAPAPSIEKQIVLPPPSAPPPPVARTLRFVTPTVVTTNVTDPPPTHQELENNNPGTTTQNGREIVAIPPENITVTEDETPRLIVEEMPQFPGGEEKMLKYIADNTRYPIAARENNITGVVYVTFVVAKDGKIKDAAILHGFNAACDEEALRVIKSMPPWKPGKQNGNFVPVIYRVPLRFRLK